MSEKINREVKREKIMQEKRWEQELEKDNEGVEKVKRELSKKRSEE